MEQVEDNNGDGKPASSPSAGDFSARSNQKVAPRYLSPSTGSCHDVCKYGRKHTFEEKPWKSFPRRTTKLPADALSPGEDPISVALDKNKVVEEDSSSNAKASTRTKSVSRLPKTSLEKLPVLPSTRSYVSKPKATSDPQLHLMEKDGSKVIHFSKRRPSTVKKHTSPEPPEVIKSVCFPSDTVEAPSDIASSFENSLSKLKPSSLLESSVNGKQTRGFASGKSHTVSKALHPSVGALKPALSSLKTALKLSSPRKNSFRSLSRTPVLGKSSSFKTRKGGHLKLASSLKDQKKVPEKTLHVIKMGTGEESHEPKFERAAYSSLDQKKIRTAVSENTTGSPSPSPVKLKFKSGKVVDPQLGTDSPRRLRFRRLYGAEGGSKLEMRRRAFLKTGVANADSALNTELSSEKIVLKHQDVQDRKEAQGLLNNVIEETASKLAVTRKSKVKALVGAFETVISLQESRPSPQSLL